MRVSVHVNLIGRFGNNAIQWTVARIIHEITGWQLSISQENRDLRQTYNLPFDYGDQCFENMEHFPNLQPFIPGEVIPNRIRFDDRNFESIEDVIDLARTRGMGIELHGFFQKAKLFTPWLDKIREWFAVSSLPVVNDNAWVIHIRRGDYLAGKQELPFEFYEKIIRMWKDDPYIDEKNTPLSIVGDDENFARRLSALWWGAEVVRGTSIEDFKLIMAHPNIVCANSSFSRWASVLSNADQIIIPRPVRGKFWGEGSAQEMFGMHPADVLMEA